MIKIDYQFKTKTPLHTGSDKNLGILKSLRRQKIILHHENEYSSYFNDDERVEAIVQILIAVHKSINFDNMKQKRIMGLWDEWYSKLLRAATVRNKRQFLNELCVSWDIRSINNINIVDVFEKISDEELLETIRNDAHYIILKLRKRAKEKNVQNIDMFKEDIKKDKYIKTYEMIPIVSGNSIRGIIRRLGMHDFIDKIGITKISKDNYHILFTGGVLDESTMYEDIEKREKLIAMCPIIGVLGAAIGNMTIEGMVSVGMAYPVCRELGTGKLSFWEYLDTIFQTRSDSSKTEKEIEIVGEHEEPDQMKYEYEVFSPGTIFNHGFRMFDFNPLLVSTFWHLLFLFKENPFIGGMRAVGNAEIDLSELNIPRKSNELYINYIEENKNNIKEFFDVK